MQYGLTRTTRFEMHKCQARTVVWERLEDVVRFHSKEKQGPVAQLVSAPPCHGGGRGFESRQGRKALFSINRLRTKQCDRHSVRVPSGQVAQLVRASA